MDKVVEETRWEFKAIRAGVLPKQVVIRDSKYHYSIRYDRCHVDRWIEEQKLLEQVVNLVKVNKTRDKESLLSKFKQLYQAARQYLTP